MRTPVSAPSLFALALLSLGGCEIGQTNSNDDSADGDTDSDTDNTDNTDNAGDPDAAPGPGLAAAATPPAQTTELLTSGAAAAGDQETRNAKNRFELEVESMGGFTGDVTFSVTGLGTGWTGTFDPPTLTLGDGDSATTTLRVEVTSTGEVGAKTLTLTASSDAGDVSKAVTMTTEAIVTVSDVIPFPAVTIKGGTEFRIRNDSANPHMIHGPGNQRASTDAADFSADGGAFPHENTGGAGHAMGEFYAVKPDPGTYSWYGHNFGAAGDAVNLTVEAP
jgi:hypothetical protein